jgi:hypothetical protein
MILDVTKTAKLICSVIKKMPRYWDGKKLILEMKENNGRNWRQMEWIGWYFEYWCNKNLKGIMEMPHSKKYGNVSFDGYLEVPWDFKVHAQSGEKIIINARHMCQTPDTLEKIGIRLNISKERVRQIEASAINKLKLRIKNFVIEQESKTKNKNLCRIPD